MLYKDGGGGAGSCSLDMEVGAGQEHSDPVFFLKDSYYQEGYFATPSDAAELMEPTHASANIEVVDLDPGAAEDLYYGAAAEETIDPTGCSVSDGYQERNTARPEGHDWMPDERTQATEEPIDITGSSGVDENPSSTPAGFKRRFRGRNGSDVRVVPSREMGAVEHALRNAATRKTKHMLEPVVATSFDSLVEAYEFYNLYSWEVGFGIRYGTSYTSGKGYKTSQDLLC